MCRAVLGKTEARPVRAILGFCWFCFVFQSKFRKLSRESQRHVIGHYFVIHATEIRLGVAILCESDLGDSGDCREEARKVPGGPAAPWDREGPESRPRGIGNQGAESTECLKCFDDSGRQVTSTRSPGGTFTAHPGHLRSGAFARHSRIRPCPGSLCKDVGLVPHVLKLGIPHIFQKKNNLQTAAAAFVHIC